MKHRIYIDTSVFGGHFDEEFAEHTIPLFDRLKDNEFTLPCYRKAPALWY